MRMRNSEGRDATWMANGWIMDVATQKVEFGQLMGVTYLDHAGATLYSKSQLEAYTADLTANLYSNPHSHSPSSLQTTAAVDHTRDSILRFFGTDSSRYNVVFTSGCTGALKLLGECFPWRGKNAKLKRTNMDVIYTRDLRESKGNGRASIPSESGERRSIFCYLEDNHTSVVGIREVAAQFGASVVCASVDDIIELDDGMTTLEYGAASTASIPVIYSNSSSDCNEIFNLFAYPAQSNFSGRKYPLSWAVAIPNGHVSIAGIHPPFFPKYSPKSWKICLDAASHVGTSPLDLAKCPVDFVTLSFYKIFGFPTGLGALLVRKDNTHLLNKAYFGGGTVVSTVSRTALHVPRPELHERLEDGTIPFLDILALKHGFQTLSRLAGPMTLVSQHTFSLARYVHGKLSDMKHSNGTPVCVLYCDGDFMDPSKQGGIVNFNLLRPNGDFVGYSEVAELACVHDIHLRTGCFCNTGACMIHLHMDTADVLQHMKAGHVCGDSVDLVDGKPTGSVRISFGYMSTLKEAEKFVSFVEQNFQCCPGNDTLTDGEVGNNTDVIGRCGGDVIMASNVIGRGGQVEGEREGVREMERGRKESGCTKGEGKREGRVPPKLRVGDLVRATSVEYSGSLCECSLESISVYPVKSCGAMQVPEWQIGGCGLQYDRKWVVLSEHGACLSQKQDPRLSLIHPYAHSHSQELELQCKGWSSVKIPITEDCEEERGGMSVGIDLCQLKVCGDSVGGVDCGPAVAAWLTDVLGKECRLVRQTQQRRAKKLSLTTASGSGGDAPLLSLANEAQYLLVTRASAEQLLSEISKKHSKQLMSVDELLSRFRPNLVVSGNGMVPYAEDEWSDVIIGGHKFKVMGQCSRCRTVCVNQRTGIKTSEPLQTLMQHRGSRATFGIYLQLSEEV